MLGASNWCGHGACGASLVRVWHEFGAPEAALPAPRAGQERFGAPGTRRACVGAARGGNWCARRKIGAPGKENVALPTPRAKQERFGAPGNVGAHDWCCQGTLVHTVGAPEFCVWCASPIAALPAPRAGQGPFLHGPCSKLGRGKHATFFLASWHVPDSALHKGRAEFAFSWSQGTILCSALVVGRAELPILAWSPMLLS
ncbi:uncharacterized protein DS421_10g301280 [Arachis hypogaea]|nr:uncharacterized protein DS421_10g301280 [Arachis hypogaea]